MSSEYTTEDQGSIKPIPLRHAIRLIFAWCEKSILSVGGNKGFCIEDPLMRHLVQSFGFPLDNEQTFVAPGDISQLSIFKNEHEGERLFLVWSEEQRAELLKTPLFEYEQYGIILFDIDQYLKDICDFCPGDMTLAYRSKKDAESVPHLLKDQNYELFDFLWFSFDDLVKRFLPQDFLTVKEREKLRKHFNSNLTRKDFPKVATIKGTDGKNLYSFRDFANHYFQEWKSISNKKKSTKDPLEGINKSESETEDVFERRLFQECADSEPNKSIHEITDTELDLNKDMTRARQITFAFWAGIERFILEELV